MAADAPAAEREGSAAEAGGGDPPKLSEHIEQLGRPLQGVVRERLDWLAACVAKGIGHLATLREADKDSESFADTREDCEFELEVTLTRIKFAVKDLERQRWAAESQAAGAELARLKEREAIGPLLAAKAARDLLSGNLATASGDDNDTDPTAQPQCSGGPDCDCANCGQSCPHREMVANRVMDGVFDEHSRLLRRRLRAQEEELKGYRDGSKLREMAEALAESERKLERQERLLAEANRKWLDAKEQQMRDRQQHNAERGALTKELDELRSAAAVAAAAAQLKAEQAEAAAAGAGQQAAEWRLRNRALNMEMRCLRSVVLEWAAELRERSEHFAAACLADEDGDGDSALFRLTSLAAQRRNASRFVERAPPITCYAELAEEAEGQVCMSTEDEATQDLGDSLDAAGGQVLAALRRAATQIQELVQGALHSGEGKAEAAPAKGAPAAPTDAPESTAAPLVSLRMPEPPPDPPRPGRRESGNPQQSGTGSSRSTVALQYADGPSGVRRATLQPRRDQSTGSSGLVSPRNNSITTSGGQPMPVPPCGPCIVRMCSDGLFPSARWKGDVVSSASSGLPPIPALPGKGQG
eukprot:TRINITY_DN6669_c0_g1_i2.p1 TRINITY_DN6669_c0_g1~~TRINITY_DN6669_c0_g1_i2.p1  ORF type:complete len:610 (+),score=212.06 TRINITY_DN6669_c0_g1_i2:74-1831(+)